MALADDIARDIGVSPATVRNVLSGRNKEIWPSAKRRADEIREAAASRRYRINTAARAIATGRFNNIALVLSREDFHVHMFQEALLSLRNAARKANLHVVLGDLPTEDTAPDHLPDFLRELSVDGMLVSCIDEVAASVFPWINHYRIPAVWMNIKLPADCLFPDDQAGAIEATSKLIELGHRSILYIDNSRNRHYSRVDRLTGYSAAMTSASLPLRITDIDVTSPGELGELLRAAGAPTAIVAYGWEFAVRAYCVALGVGLKVPTDLSIISFHSAPVWFTDKPIATMLIPAVEMGRRGVEELERKIATPTYSVEPLALPFGYFQGASVDVPPNL
jgi:LacI family transcriptional regulator